ncbi:MAG: glucosyl transferase [Candidatus Hydrogenedentota bacterium]
MNILHIDDQLGWRGGEQQASYLIAGLTKLGHRCVVAGRAAGAFLRSGFDGAEVIRVAIPCWGEMDPISPTLLARAVRAYDIDILHAHSSHAATYACVARKLARRGRVVVSRRVDFPPARNAFSAWKYAQPDRIVAISQCINRVLRAYGVPESKLRVVMSGIDPDRLNGPPIERDTLGIPGDAVLAGNVAALVGHKDHATLVAAMPAILREIPNFRLIVAGEGALRKPIESQIRELGVSHAVKLLGQRDDVPRLLRAMDLFILSSSEEGLGTSVLDAMACGVPVVATDAGGISEMVRNGETGLLAPPRDPAALAAAVVRMVRDADLRTRVKDAAAELVRDQFTVDRMVEGNLRVYEELLAG